MIKSDKRNFDNYFVRRLRKNETIKSFDCGDEDLNDFIMNRVDDYLKTMLAVTYVFEHKATGKIIGYFSLANDRISIDDFDNNTKFNRFRKHRFETRNVSKVILRSRFADWESTTTLKVQVSEVC